MGVGKYILGFFGIIFGLVVITGLSVGTYELQDIIVNLFSWTQIGLGAYLIVLVFKFFAAKSNTPEHHAGGEPKGFFGNLFGSIGTRMRAGAENMLDPKTRAWYRHKSGESFDIDDCLREIKEITTKTVSALKNIINFYTTLETHTIPVDIPEPADKLFDEFSSDIASFIQEEKQLINGINIQFSSLNQLIQDLSVKTSTEQDRSKQIIGTQVIQKYSNFLKTARVIPCLDQKTVGKDIASAKANAKNQVLSDSDFEMRVSGILKQIVSKQKRQFESYEVQLTTINS